MFSDKGGDTVQLLRTRESLQSMGVTVDVSTEFEPSLEAYDLVHLFNLKLVESTYLQLLNAKKQGKPVVFSPIYWRLDEEEDREFLRLQESTYGKITTKYIQSIKDALKRVNCFQPMISLYTKAKKSKRYQPPIFYKLRKEIGERRMQTEVLAKSDILLPNAEAEMRVLARDFGLSKGYIVVPNGVDLRFGNGTPDAFCEKYGLRDFVLCVARVEERKNQLSVIRALRDGGMTLVLVGKEREPYTSRCRRESGPKVRFLGHLEGNELASAYAAARVHVLASWYETPGLSSMEAALAGCSIVVTRKGATEEYFGSHADYCDPNDIASIRDAISRAWKRPPPLSCIDINS
jgi:glycosyltransferase involved in cell wall biosynthesis